jgi:GT2 family glycosyltransferase
MTATPTISVVVCTHGEREGSLRALIDALSRQTIPFEMVVVLGPSSPATREIVARLGPHVRCVECAELNVSRARNTGIRVAAGDIIVFIDDDAVPAQDDWLEQLTAPMRESDVAAVGGAVYRARTDFLEFAGGATSLLAFQKFGNDDWTAAAPDGTKWILRVPGGNCAWSRRAIAELGGFDEQFAYYLDEADVCVRLAAAGYRIVYAPHAPIRHFPGPSAHGPAGQRSRFPVARSDAYFVLRHAPGSRGHRVLSAIRIHSSKHFVAEAPFLYKSGDLSFPGLVRFRMNCWRGLAAGIWAGLLQGPRLTVDTTAPSLPWLAFAPPAATLKLVVSDSGRKLAAEVERLARLVDSDERLHGEGLALLRQCVQDGHHDLAITLGYRLRSTMESAQRSEVGYHLAYALRMLGKREEACGLYEDIRRSPAAPHIRAGACFHLASDARTADSHQRAADLLIECLEHLPEHGAARRMLDELSRRDLPQLEPSVLAVGRL